MYDIFLSYATTDRTRLEPLVAAFEQRGWSVFWDHRSIGAGDDWSDEIETAAYENLCMVVVWSHNSLETTVHGEHTRYAIRSKWIRKEAKIAEKREVLIPISLDGIPSPDLFDEYQLVDFKDWNQQATHSTFSKLAQKIQTHVTRHAEQQAAARRKQELENRAQNLEQLAKNLAAQREKLTRRKLDIERQQAEWNADDKALQQQETELARQQRELDAALHPPLPPQQPAPSVIQPHQPVILQAQPMPIQVVARQPFEPEMVAIPAGSFTMGWLNGRDGEGYADENPAHTVRLRHFELGKYPITQAQWQAVMGNNPSHFSKGGDTCPVEQVSWHDVQEFIQKLNQKTGQTYRLLSEAEWEYACRAGENHLYSGSNYVDQVAWHNGNSDGKTHPVGQKQANAWCLHDMSGNVWEWVQDTKHANYQGAPSDGSAWEDARATARVLRGGSWGNVPQNVRAASRSNNAPSGRVSNVGFRLARTLP